METKAVRFVLVALTAALFCSTCAGRRARREVLPEESMLNEPFRGPPLSVDILDYKNRENGEELSPWVSVYLDYGNQGVETLFEYEGYHVFVSLQNGNDPVLLSRWVRSFSVSQDFSRLAAVRIRRRFIHGLTRSADYEYGRNFEAAVTTAYNTQFWGAWKADDAWILAEERGSDKIEYLYLILVLVSRERLESQISEMLSGLKPEGNSRENAAFNHTRENFFEGF